MAAAAATATPAACEDKKGAMAAVDVLIEHGNVLPRLRVVRERAGERVALCLLGVVAVLAAPAVDDALRVEDEDVARVERAAGEDDLREAHVPLPPLHLEQLHREGVRLLLLLLTSSLLALKRVIIALACHHRQQVVISS